MEVTAVVVTYNRADLLEACLDAVAAQTRAPERVIVVDNASTDRTPQVLAEREAAGAIEVLLLPSNEGSAGGFREGGHAALRTAAEWLWLMDDDTIPEPTALERLCEGQATAARCGPQPTLVASRAVWTDGRLHPMNTALPALRDMEGLVDGAAEGLVLIRSASFVSLLLNRGAVDRHGLPIKRYFIWSDDVEYTARVLRRETGYLVPGSVVQHKTRSPYLTFEGPPDRFFYQVRNSIYMVRGPAWDTQEKLRVLWMLLISIRQFLIHKRWSPRAALVVARGLAHGVATPPNDG